MTEKKREYHLHKGEFRNCDFCGEKYEVINVKQRFCPRPKSCYMSFHSKDKNEESNAKRRGDGKYVFRHIKERCGNPNSKAYKDYGQKGVKCKFKSFEDFQRVYFRTDKCENCAVPLNDDNRRARDGRNIHRENSDGHYEESNCAIVCKACNNRLDRNDKRGWI